MLRDLARNGGTSDQIARVEAQIEKFQQFINGLQQLINADSKYEEFLKYTHNWQDLGFWDDGRIGEAMRGLPAPR